MKKFRWTPEQFQFHKPSLTRSLWQLISTFVLFIVFWYLTYRAVSISYGLALLLAIPTAGFAVRIFIFAHDCGHGSFFKNKRLNTIVGRLCSFICFTPYYFWKEQHAAHHRTNGNLDYRNIGGDIWMMTTKEYQEAPLYMRIAYRVYRGPLLFMGVIPTIYFVLGLRINYQGFKGGNSVKLRNSLIVTNIFLVICVIGMCWLIGVKQFIEVELPIRIIGSTIGVWLFYVQHQYGDVNWERTEKWDFDQASITGSSFYKLPKILQWFSGSIGFHHVHHINPLIPNYYLEKCHESNSLLKSVQPLTIRESLKTVRLKLWDEEHHKMTGYPPHKKLLRNWFYKNGTGANVFRSLSPENLDKDKPHG